MTDQTQRTSAAEPKYRWVSDAESLGELAQQLATASAHALDSESNSGFVYRERLCLLQFNVADELWLVDLLALPDRQDALEPLRGPLESPSVTTWLHGGEFDVGSMKRDFGIDLGGVWDTQQAASFLGWEKTGYGAVVERICSIKLDKAFAHYDWGRRPIVEEVVRYALDDVRFLPQVAQALVEEVAAADLVEETEVANRTVMSAVWSAPSQRNGIWRFKGVHKLDERHLPRLVALWEWREAEAKSRDLPPGRLLHPEVLLSIARRRIGSPRELRGLLRGRNASYAEDVFAVIERAARKPPAVPPRPSGTRLSPGEGRRLKKLKQWRRSEAERRGVPQQVVLPPTAMQYLAREGCGDLDAVPQLGEKRIRLYGVPLSQICS